jgi:hypothetical protein
MCRWWMKTTWSRTARTCEPAAAAAAIKPRKLHHSIAQCLLPSSACGRLMVAGVGLDWAPRLSG